MTASHLPDDWSPKNEEDRRYYHHAQSGDRGYLVRRGGKSMIRRDLPNQEILRRLDEDWIEDDATRPLTPIHVARICFEADRALCAALGHQDKAREEWGKLTDSQRQAWITRGPLRPSARVVLYATLQRAMGAYLGSR